PDGTLVARRKPVARPARKTQDLSPREPFGALRVGRARYARMRRLGLPGRAGRLGRAGHLADGGLRCGEPVERVLRVATAKQQKSRTRGACERSNAAVAASVSGSLAARGRLEHHRSHLKWRCKTRSGEELTARSSF